MKSIKFIQNFDGKIKIYGNMVPHGLWSMGILDMRDFSTRAAVELHWGNTNAPEERLGQGKNKVKTDVLEARKWC